MSTTLSERDLEACVRAYVQGQVYALLAEALADPSHVLEGRLLVDLDRVLSESGAPEAVRADLAELASAAADLRARPRELEREYTSLFVKAEVPPYESSYLPGGRLTQELADVAGFLRAFGLRTNLERPDHIVSELEFVAFLCVKESIALGNGLSSEAGICRDARAKFVRDHLGRWLELYHRGLAEQARSRVYPLLLGIVRPIVDRDAAFLGVTPEPLAEVPSRDADSLPRCGVAR